MTIRKLINVFFFKEIQYIIKILRKFFHLFDFRIIPLHQSAVHILKESVQN